MLTKASDGAVSGGTNQHPLLTLAVGGATFPLFKTTMFGTMNDDERVYVFTPESGARSEGEWVVDTRRDSSALTQLCESYSAGGCHTTRVSVWKLQTQFEQILVHHGLLKEGLRKSMREGSANVAQSVRESTSRCAGCFLSARAN